MLFDGYEIKGNKIKNRIVMPPMVTFMLAKEDGYVTDKHITYYEKRAKSEVGTIIVEAAATDKAQRPFYQLGIWDDKFVEGLSKIAKVINDNDCFSVIQLHNPGVRAAGKLSEHPYGAGAHPDYEGSREVKKEELPKVKEYFVNAAVRAKKAGFKAVELHGAHGYLLCEFTAPNYNKRTDEYGGSLENRFRFPIEVIKAVREAIGEDMPIYYRYGPCVPDIKSGIEGAKMLIDAGVDVLDISYANKEDVTLETDNPDFNYSVYSAKLIKEAVDVPVIAVNMISTPKRAEYLLRNDYADFTAIGRELIADYQWAYKAKNDIPINYCYHCKPKCHMNRGDYKCPNLIKADETLY